MQFSGARSWTKVQFSGARSWIKVQTWIHKYSSGERCDPWSFCFYVPMENVSLTWRCHNCQYPGLYARHLRMVLIVTHLLWHGSPVFAVSIFRRIAPFSHLLGQAMSVSDLWSPWPLWGWFIYDVHRGVTTRKNVDVILSQHQFARICRCNVKERWLA